MPSAPRPPEPEPPAMDITRACSRFLARLAPPGPPASPAAAPPNRALRAHHVWRPCNAHMRRSHRAPRAIPARNPSALWPRYAGLTASLGLHRPILRAPLRTAVPRTKMSMSGASKRQCTSASSSPSPPQPPSPAVVDDPRAPRASPAESAAPIITNSPSV